MTFILSNRFLRETEKSGYLIIDILINFLQLYIDICHVYSLKLFFQGYSDYYCINLPIRRFVYKTGAVFGPLPGRILLLLNYKTG